MMKKHFVTDDSGVDLMLDSMKSSILKLTSTPQRHEARLNGKLVWVAMKGGEKQNYTWLVFHYEKPFFDSLLETR